MHARIFPIASACPSTTIPRFMAKQSNASGTLTPWPCQHKERSSEGLAAPGGAVPRAGQLRMPA
jgi:hypothetical protein